MFLARKKLRVRKVRNLLISTLAAVTPDSRQVVICLSFIIEFNSESGIKNITRKKLKFLSNFRFLSFVVVMPHLFVIPIFYLFFQTLKTVKNFKNRTRKFVYKFLLYYIFFKSEQRHFFKTRKIKAININNIDIKTRFKIKV